MTEVSSASIQKVLKTYQEVNLDLTMRAAASLGASAALVVLVSLGHYLSQDNEEDTGFSAAKIIAEVFAGYLPSTAFKVFKYFDFFKPTSSVNGDSTLHHNNRWSTVYLYGLLFAGAATTFPLLYSSYKFLKNCIYSKQNDFLFHTALLGSVAESICIAIATLRDAMAEQTEIKKKNIETIHGSLQSALNRIDKNFDCSIEGYTPIKMRLMPEEGSTLHYLYIKFDCTNNPHAESKLALTTAILAQQLDKLGYYIERLDKEMIIFPTHATDTHALKSALQEIERTLPMVFKNAWEGPTSHFSILKQAAKTHDLTFLENTRMQVTGNRARINLIITILDANERNAVLPLIADYYGNDIVLQNGASIEILLHNNKQLAPPGKLLRAMQSAILNLKDTSPAQTAYWYSPPSGGWKSRATNYARRFWATEAETAPMPVQEHPAPQILPSWDDGNERAAKTRVCFDTASHHHIHWTLGITKFANANDHKVSHGNAQTRANWEELIWNGRKVGYKLRNAGVNRRPVVLAVARDTENGRELCFETAAVLTHKEIQRINNGGSVNGKLEQAQLQAAAEVLENKAANVSARPKTK